MLDVRLTFHCDHCQALCGSREPERVALDGDTHGITCTCGAQYEATVSLRCVSGPKEADHD